MATEAYQHVTIDEALANRELKFFCVECHKPVRPHTKGLNGQAAHFEHIERNSLCSLSHVWAA